MLFAREGFDNADAGKSLLHRHDHLAHAFKLASERLWSCGYGLLERLQARGEVAQKFWLADNVITANRLAPIDDADLPAELGRGDQDLEIERMVLAQVGDVRGLLPA